MSNLKILKPGTEFILEAISFTHSKNIEKSAPLIQWTITPEGGNVENIGTGKTIRYKISKKYAGKKVTFRAFIKDDSRSKYPQQRLTCFVEEQVSVDGVLIKEVTGTAKSDLVTYNITSEELAMSFMKLSFLNSVMRGDSFSLTLSEIFEHTEREGDRIDNLNYLLKIE